MSSIVQEVSKISTVSPKNISKLLDIMGYIIIDNIIDDIHNNTEITEIDFQFGTLSILHTDKDLKFKFTPSAKFEESLKTAVIEDTSSLETVLEQVLVDKLLEVYKDLI